MKFSFNAMAVFPLFLGLPFMIRTFISCFFIRKDNDKGTAFIGKCSTSDEKTDAFQIRLKASSRSPIMSSICSVPIESLIVLCEIP